MSLPRNRCSQGQAHHQYKTAESRYGFRVTTVEAETTQTTEPVPASRHQSGHSCTGRVHIQVSMQRIWTDEITGGCNGKEAKGERPGGLIQVSLDVGYDENGKRKRKYFYGHTRAEANEKKDRLIALLNEGGPVFKSHLRQGLKNSEALYDAFLARFYTTQYGIFSRKEVDP